MQGDEKKMNYVVLRRKIILDRKLSEWYKRQSSDDLIIAIRSHLNFRLKYSDPSQDVGVNSVFRTLMKYKGKNVLVVAYFLFDGYTGKFANFDTWVMLAEPNADEIPSDDSLHHYPAGSEVDEQYQLLMIKSDNTGGSSFTIRQP